MPQQKLNLHTEKDVVLRFGLRTAKDLEIIKNKKIEHIIKRTIQIGQKKRDIVMPREPLKQFLLNMQNALRQIPLPAEFYGGVKGKSVIDNAKMHMHKRYVMKLDIANFFPSITTAQVASALAKQGCRENISKILSEIITVDGHLPQGFNTSPLISIHILMPIISEIRSLIKDHKCVLTIWMDDITISCEESPEILIEPITKIINKFGFKLKDEKYSLAERGVAPQVVTGVLINYDELLPANGYIEDTDQMIDITNTEDIDLLNATFETNFANTADAYAHINGRISWIKEFKIDVAEKLQQKLPA
jgi:hypothetical protein